jgi:hypothetical protein
MALIFSLWLLLMYPGFAAWAEPAPTGAKTEIKGDVLYWEGDELVVKEMSGREVRLVVTADTKIQGASGRLKTGDKISAQVAPEGPALSITLQIPDSGGPPVR